MVSSINTNIAAYYAQGNINSNQSSISASVARLSSGNRIVRASDDVAGLSIGTSLRTNVSTLKIAKLNTSLGGSLLQVADGALAQVTEILQRQKALATQAGSGSLTSTERSFLNQEFQALTDEVDRLVGQTNFNGVKLLDGTLSERVGVTDTKTASTKASATLTFSDNPDNDETIIINGVTVTAVNDGASTSVPEIDIGATTSQSVSALADKLNNAETDDTFTSAQKLAIGKATYTAQGNTLVVTARSGGTAGEVFRINMSGTAVDTVVEAGIGAKFGGSYFTIFQTGFSSATSVIAATTAAASTPYQIADEIKAVIAGSTFVLHTVAAGDSLQAIVNDINANRSTTGVRAELTYGTDLTYNIRLEYDDPRSAVSFSQGAAYSSSTYVTNYDYSSSQNLFATGFASSTATISQTSSTTGSVPFEIGSLIEVSSGGATTTQTIHTIAASDGLDDIVTGINAATSSTGVHATLISSGGLYNIRLEYDDGTNDLTIKSPSGYNNSTYAFPAASASAHTGPLVRQHVYGLAGGVDNGIGQTSTSVSGSIGNDIITGLNQTKAKVTLSFPEVAAADITATSNFGNASGVAITVGGHSFVFTSNTSKASDEITIGDTLEKTLDNAVSTINAYQGVGSEEYQLGQLKVYRDGRNLVFESKDLANVTTLANATSTVSISNFSTVSATNSGNLDNADTGGTVTSGVQNVDFIGTIKGFKATYVSSDTADLSITVGKFTYTAQSVATKPTSDTTVRLYSNTLADGSSGGYFDIELKANKGEEVIGQTSADTFAARLDAAFGTLTFYQKRNVSSYTGSDAIVTDGVVTGSLVGTSVSIQQKAFSDVKIDSIAVVAPAGSNPNGSLTLTVNGEKYTTASNLGSQLGANQTYRLVSVLDSNKFIEFTTGNSTIDFGSDAKASAFQAALKTGFGVGDGSAKLAFQVGATTSDTLKVGINSVTTNSIFDGKTLDILTQEGAQIAGDTLDKAIKTVTSVRADVGALQSRFNFAAANIESSAQNQDAARGELLDTDISSESTSFAVAQVKLQAGISTLAQANQQLQSLLKLIG